MNFNRAAITCYGGMKWWHRIFPRQLGANLIDSGVVFDDEKRIVTNALPGRTAPWKRGVDECLGICKPITLNKSLPIGFSHGKI